MPYQRHPQYNTQSTQDQQLKINPKSILPALAEYPDLSLGNVYPQNKRNNAD
jgi:hypothetical protein